MASDAAIVTWYLSALSHIFHYAIVVLCYYGWLVKHREIHTEGKTRFIVFVLLHTGARVKMDNWESGTTRRRSGYVLSKPSSHGLSGLLSLVAETLLPFAMMARWAPSSFIFFFFFTLSLSLF